MKSFIRSLLLLFVFSFLFSTAAAAGSLGVEVNKELADVRKATAKYQKIERAFEDGYMLMDEYVPGMGYHAVNFAIAGEEGHDPVRPEVLVYTEKSNGGYKLVAVEYLAMGGERPSLFGRDFDNGPFPGSFALHVWLWQHNPDGLFEAHNPRIP